MPKPAWNLALTEPELAALSITLRTLLKGWGDSEDQSQKRFHARLSAISAKLETLSPTVAHAKHPARAAAEERHPASH